MTSLNGPALRRQWQKLCLLAVFLLLHSLTVISRDNPAEAMEILREAPKPVSVIYDTDICSDCDDVGALAMLHAMADAGEVELLAVMVSARDEYAAACTDAINTFFGRPDLPVGNQPIFAPRESRYTRVIAKEYPHDLKSGKDAPDSAKLYRRILAGQPDRSVTIITVGYATNVRNLLATGPDEISPLSGPELVAKKVHLYAAGGNGAGALPDGKAGFNYQQDLEAAKYEVEHFPRSVPMVYAGGAGNAVRTGPRLSTETSDGHIVRRCYELHFQGRSPWARPSWDQLRVLYGVRGLGDNFTASERGTVSLDMHQGRIRFKPDKEGNCYWLKLAKPGAQVAREIEDLMVHIPIARPSSVKSP
jgi:hypothetical protein